MGYWQEDRHIDQWKKMYSLDIDPYKYGQLIFDHDAKVIQYRKILLSTNYIGNQN